MATNQTLEEQILRFSMCKYFVEQLYFLSTGELIHVNHPEDEILRGIIDNKPYDWLLHTTKKYKGLPILITVGIQMDDYQDYKYIITITEPVYKIYYLDMTVGN